MLSRMKLIHKLILMLLLPVVGLFYFSITGIWTKLEISSEMSSLNDLSNLAVRISAFVHESQKERGRTGGYLGSKGLEFSNELLKQKNDTNQKLNTLTGFLKDFDKTDLGEAFNKTLNHAVVLIDKLQDKRQAIKALKITGSDAISYYSEMNAAFLDIIKEISKVSQNAEITILASAYVHFLLGKEKAGMERAVLTSAFAVDHFSEGKFAYFSSLVIEQKVYDDIFFSLATTKQKDFYRRSIRGKAIEEVKRMRKTAFAKANTGQFDLKANHWFNMITEKIDLLKKVEDQLSKDLNSKAIKLKSAAQFELIFYLSLTGLVVITAFYLVYTISHGIIRQLGDEPANIEKIAHRISEGDLTIEFNSIAKEDSGVFAAMNLMTSNLKQIIGSIIDAASQLAATSEQINASASNLSEGAESQAASVEESSASTEELVSLIRAVSEHTFTMRDKSKLSLKEAKAYKINIQKVSEEMVNINHSTKTIGDIIKVINDIADQTNLLALNAAIEAARAGEHGKGFAVVADAISSLANRSAESTKKIEKLIKESVEMMNTGVKSVQMATESFESIIHTIEENDHIVNDITKSSEEQYKGSEQIQKSTEEISNLTQNASASAEELAASTSELQNLAERLNGLVRTFKI